MWTADDPLPDAPRRVAVAGVSGVGKTTLARRIAAIIDAEHVEIDGLYHGPNWQPRPSFAEDVRALVARDAWVTEWQYSLARPLIAERADLLVWLDLPFWTTTFPRVVRRTLRRRIRREVLWNGNLERPLYTFFTDDDHIVRWSISTRHSYHRRLLGPAAPRRIVRLTSRAEIERWVHGPLAGASDCRPR